MYPIKEPHVLNYVYLAGKAGTNVGDLMMSESKQRPPPG